MAQQKRSVVIVGASFAGLSAAAQLPPEVEVTLIDPNPFFEFLPNIHELISRYKKGEELQLGKKEIIEGMGHRLIVDRVISIDRDAKVLQMEHGGAISFDSCLLTIGGVNNTRGVPGVDAYTFPFKSVAQCDAIGKQLQTLSLRNTPFSVGIVGAGVEGLEALGEILRAYRESPIQIHLIERNPGFTIPTAEKIGKEVCRLCADLPIGFHFNRSVKEVKSDALLLDNGQKLAVDLCIWTGGVQVHPMLREAGLLAKEDEWAPVNEYLQSVYGADIFIAGDSVSVPGAEEKQGYYALAMGEIAGKNLLRHLHGESLLPYHPQAYPSIYSFGDLSCFVSWKTYAIAGFPLASAKESLYQYNMAQMQHPDSLESCSEVAVRSLTGLWSLAFSYLYSPLSIFQKSRVRLL